ncbi:hypothetical protein [Tenacibaculum maritimum]|uniref:hypothetical protein n=1 Tax=Tenacibaculum maritimum TaxID=107401 RepID=UPI00132F72B8|nr:hypothetical protein [Tenacibaculum maritimum]
MKNHIRIYLSAFGYSECDFIPSELSGKKAVDIHHIECKGMGGNPKKEKDRIENLMALTREEHICFGDKEQYMAFLYKKHLSFLDLHGVKFDKQYILNKMMKFNCTHTVE